MVSSCGRSHAGKVRYRNEDAFADRPDLGLFVVADGMGGAQAGDKASRTTADILIKQLEKPSAQPGRSLANAVILANTMILTVGRVNPDFEGMATTVTALLLDPPKGYVASVGDCRLYRLRGGELSCLTKDDSWVADIAKTLGLTDEEIHGHPYRNVLTQALGGEEKVEFEVDEIQLQSGDLFLLCSDGLHGVVEEQTILRVLKSAEPLEKRCEALIEAAFVCGAPDNVTALLVEWQSERDTDESKAA
jgi:protein phosphatase